MQAVMIDDQSQCQRNERRDIPQQEPQLRIPLKRDLSTLTFYHFANGLPTKYFLHVCQLFILQMSFLFVISKGLFKSESSGKKDLDIIAARFLTAIFLHLTLAPHVRQVAHMFMIMGKSEVNQRYANHFGALLTCSMRGVVLLSCELCNIFLICKMDQT